MLCRQEHTVTLAWFSSLWAMRVHAGLPWASRQLAAPSHPEHAHGAEGWKERLQGASPLQPLNARDSLRQQTRGRTLHLASKLPVIFSPTWNPPDSVSRVLPYASLASLSRSVFLLLGAHWMPPAPLGSWRPPPSITPALPSVTTPCFIVLFDLVLFL